MNEITFIISANILNVIQEGLEPPKHALPIISAILFQCLPIASPNQKNLKKIDMPKNIICDCSYLQYEWVYHFPIRKKISETGLEPAKSNYGIFLLSDYSKGSGLEPENIDF